MRHFYSEEWTINYLSFDLYPKNPLLRYGSWILSIFSDTIFNAIFATQIAHQVDNINDNYYLISRDNMKFLAHVTKGKLEVINISDMKIKKGNIIFNLKHFAYEEKMFEIHKYTDPSKISNVKHVGNIIKTTIKVCVAIIVIMVLYVLIMGLIS